MSDEHKYIPSSPRAYYHRAFAHCFNKRECAECGTNKRLQIHHIDEDIRNNEPDNLVCLCVNCHALKHGDIAQFIKANPQERL